MRQTLKDAPLSHSPLEGVPRVIPSVEWPEGQLISSLKGGRDVVDVLAVVVVVVLVVVVVVGVVARKYYIILASFSFKAQ